MAERYKSHDEVGPALPRGARRCRYRVLHLAQFGGVVGKVIATKASLAKR